MAQSAEELRREIAHTRADLTGTLDAIGDRVSPGRVIERRKNRMTDSVRSVRERVMGTAHDARSAVMGEAHSIGGSISGSISDMGGSISDRKDSAMSAIREAPSTVSHKAEGSPMIAGAIALGIGFLAAAAFPATRKEREAGSAVLDRVEPMKQQLTSVGQEMAEHLREPVAAAATSVKEAATESAQAIAETAKGAAQDTKEQATSAVQAVKSGGAS